jgi:phosphate-selective porin OprO and OprP
MSTFCQHRARVFAGLWLATLLVSTLVLRAADSTNLTVHATDDPHPSGEGPTRLGQSTRVVLNTNAPVVTAAETNAPGPAQKSFTWKVAWEGWNGLQLEAVQRTPLTDPMESLGLQPKGTGPLSYLHLEQVKLSGKFGARLEVDGAAFATTGDLTGFDPGVQLRRLRVFAGGDCILVLPLSYYIELGYGAGKFYLNQSTLTFPAGKYLGTLQVGQFQAPMGLENITSSRDIAFMEPAAPIQAIAPGIEAGAQIGKPIFDQRATWALGLFAPGAGAQEYGNASQNFGSAVGRLTWLPEYHPDQDNPAENRILHLGLSANFLYSASSSVRYQSRPESYIAPTIIDTGELNANSAATFGLEAAWVNGPFSVQGEFLRSNVGEYDVGDLAFYGYYAYVSWYLTGESRPYNPVAGAFKRLIPRHSVGHGGLGAVELTCRLSHTDLTDGYVQGGRLTMLMAGVNWYLQPHIRWMFNYGNGHISGGPNDGNMFIFQTRIGVDF